MLPRAVGLDGALVNSVFMFTLVLTSEERRLAAWSISDQLHGRTDVRCYVETTDGLPYLIVERVGS